MNNASSAINMSLWNDTNKHFCSWEGVSCSRKHPNRVTALQLSSSGLVGPLPPSTANLTFLKILDLSCNQFYGEIPPNLPRLPRLQYLNLSFNSFYGDISAILMTNSSVLQDLDFRENQFTGKIPPLTFSMSQLKLLNLCSNSITGTIPPSLFNFSLLETIRVCDNHLEGAIPPAIGILNSLTIINVAMNYLSGSLPSSFYNLSSLRRISVADNQLSGDISTSLARAFPYLEDFLFAVNHFTGSLDKSLQNVTSLVQLDIGKNNFIGVVPSELGKMHNLIMLSLQENMLQASDAQDWRFFDSLINCTKLEILFLDDNNFGGVLPITIGNLSTNLEEILLGRNSISGCIPFELKRYTNLIGLGMEQNHFKCHIPESLGKLSKLQKLFFDANSITGIIPDSLGNLTRLIELWLDFNQLTGTIPSNIKNLQNLFNLGLSHNKLIGLIPSELFLIPSLSSILALSYNSFTGTLPVEVGLLVNILYIDFSNNNLTGEIPETLQNCQSQQTLDLSHNNLSGDIPQSLQNIFSLEYLNLSFNNLEGEVPNKGVFANSSAIFVAGNEKLCGGISKLHLPKCTSLSLMTSRRHHFIKILVPILSILVMLFTFLLYYVLLYRKKKQSGQRRNSSNSSLSTAFSRISYTKLVKATKNFSDSCLVGYGKYGTVYRGVLRDYQAPVAIKVFNLEVHGALKTFTSECDALRRIRHRNLVRVLTSCSSIDRQGRDFKALIFEFMPKGNLDMWLHQENETDRDVILTLEKRLNIAISIADALEYLHYSCEPSIIHCDVKPRNILLDDSMTAHVGDFGLSRMLSEAMSMTLHDNSDKSGIKGTIGYIAPEYGGGAHPSTSADVYSFGIILLEMLTGKKPTDDIFKDSLNLHNYVTMTFPDRISSIIDLKMFPTAQGNEYMRNYHSINKCLLSLAELGLSCSASLPEERPSMRDVATMLHAVRVSYLQSDVNREFS